MHDVWYHEVYTIAKRFKFAGISNSMDEHLCKFVDESDDDSNNREWER